MKFLLQDMETGAHAMIRPSRNSAQHILAWCTQAIQFDDTRDDAVQELARLINDIKGGEFLAWT